jgi:hypothetical protein
VSAAAFLRSERALWRRVGASVLVTTVDDDEVHELMGGAVVVWEELATPSAVDDVVRRLVRATGMTPGDLRPEVATCVQTLADIGAVERTA